MCKWGTSLITKAMMTHNLAEKAETVQTKSGHLQGTVDTTINGAFSGKIDVAWQPIIEYEDFLPDNK
jgi:hypothetical protein